MLTAIAFMLGFLVLLVLALQRHPVHGLYAYLASFYMHPPSRWWSAYLPDLRWALLAGAVTLVAILIHKSKLQPRPSWFANVPAAIMILYCLWLWLQNLWALDHDVHFDASIQFTKYVFAFYLFWKIADTRERMTNILLTHVAGCLFLGWLAFGAGLQGDSRLNGVGGPGIDDANTLAMFLGTGVAAAATLLLQVRGWRWWLCVAAMPFMLNGMVLSASRGAFLGLMGAGLVLFFLRPPERRATFWAFAALGAVLVVGILDERFITRMLTVREAVHDSAEIDHSSEARLVLIQAQLQMAKNHPLGVGHKGTAALSARYLDETWLTRRSEDEAAARSSHNTFMTTLVEQGIPGAAMYVWLTIWGLTAIFRVKRFDKGKVPLADRAVAIACCAAIAEIWIAGQFTDYLMAEVQIWMFALLVAALRLSRVVASSKQPVKGPMALQPAAPPVSIK